MLTKTDQYVSPAEFARILQLEKSWIYRHTLPGGLLADCSIKVGKYTRINLAKASQVLGVKGADENES